MDHLVTLSVFGTGVRKSTPTFIKLTNDSIKNCQLYLPHVNLLTCIVCREFQGNTGVRISVITFKHTVSTSMQPRGYIFQNWFLGEVLLTHIGLYSRWGPIN